MGRGEVNSGHVCFQGVRVDPLRGERRDLGKGWGWGGWVGLDGGVGIGMRARACVSTLPLRCRHATARAIPRPPLLLAVQAPAEDASPASLRVRTGRFRASPVA